MAAASAIAEVCYDVGSTFGQNCSTSDSRIDYSYDGAGNRLTENRVGGTSPGLTNYVYNAANQLTTRGGTTYTYDADGNQTSEGTTTWAYDELNRLTGIDTATTDSQLTYDAFGNRTTIATGSSTRAFSWDINRPLPLLTTVTEGSNTTRYRYGPAALPIGATINGTHHALLTEDLNTVTDVYNRTTGTKTWTSEYEPFGTPRNTTSTGLTTAQVGLTYTGEYLDPTTGLYNLRLRNYNPTTSRLTTHDPVTRQPDQPYESPYAYANNQATVLTDPSGACWWCAIGAVGGSIWGGIEYAVTHEGPWDWSDFGQKIVDRGIDGALLGLPVIAGRPAAAAGGSALGRLMRSICPRGLTTGGANAVRVGQAGEAAVRGVYDIGPKATVIVRGRTRILDGLTDEAVTEVKNVARQSFTQQLKDSLSYARSTGRRFDLYVRTDTELTGPLQAAIRIGDITLRFIP